ncbi:MAG: hypothetical protein CL796_03750 [Chloroflexi bacterium]|nr:hypothetical protein [Chloroflexota bacterium]MBG73957.1 hypothetical protein [Chloroflexota bacterium]|tara:strand:+ start:2125 stop:2754 length:630 start_codon:yes stop_codon:yes gene_type:complete
MTNLIITSFEQFSKYKYNPTISVADRVSAIFNKDENFNVISEILQCKYSSIKNEVYDLYKYKPDIIISLGLGASRKSLNLEYLAQNEYSSLSPDNEGVLLQNEPIIDMGYDLKNTLDLDNLNNISNKNVKSEISTNAGKFMCNANFYWNQYKINTQNLNTKYVFIHIPFTDKYKNLEPLINEEKLPVLSEDGIVNAIVGIINELSTIKI